MEAGPTRRDFIDRCLMAMVATAGFPRASFSFALDVDRDDDLLSMSATKALALFASGDLTSERYSTALLAQCRRLKDLNAFIWLNEDNLLETARAVDQQPRKGSGARLLGLPLVLKDNI